MAVNEEFRQLEVARSAEAAARTLAHSTRTVPVPSESYALLGELGALTGHLAAVSASLASWHDGVEDGVEYDGEDEHGDGNSVAASAAALREAAQAFRLASLSLDKAQSANGAVRWRGTSEAV